MVNKIYLDSDEEITSVIDKLKNSEESEMALVVPKDSSLLQSVVNLKLIKREAEKLNKTISIITSNKVGRTLAENIGLAVSGGKSEVPKQEIPVKTPEADEDGVLIEYREEPKAGEEEEVISFKKGSIRDDEDLSVKETSPEEDEITESEEKNEESDQEKPEDTTSPDAPKTFQNAKKGKKGRINGFMVVVFLSLVGLFIFGYIYIPRATVTVSVLSQKKAFETDITVDKKEPDSKVDRGLITGNIVEVNKDFSKKFQATGKKEVGKKATGNITVSNKFDSNPQILVTGTRFSSAGLIFKTTEQVTVPGATVSGGNTLAGTISVKVEAENPGQQYNLSSAHFTIPAFVGTAKETLVYGDSSLAMSGGESKEVTIITQADFNKAKEISLKEAKDDIKKALLEKKKEGETLADELSEIGVGEASAVPSVGDEATEFTLTVKNTAKALVYNEKDLKEAYLKKTKDEVGENREIIKDGYDTKKVTFGKVDFTTGTANIGVASDIFFGTKLNKKDVFTELSGQSEKKSLDYLKAQENVKEAKIDFFPSFLKRVPRIESHVEIKTEAVEGDENKE